MGNCLALLSGTSDVWAKTVPECPGTLVVCEAVPGVFVVCEAVCDAGDVGLPTKWLATNAIAATATTPPPPAASNVRARRREMREVDRPVGTASRLLRGETGWVAGSGPLGSSTGGVAGRGEAMANDVRFASLGATIWA